MAEDITTEPGSAEGQVTEGTETSTQVTTEGIEGQSAEGTTTQGTQEDVIFDPGEFDRMVKELPAELQSQAQALRKSLQGNYTKKTQAIAEQRQKIEAYDQFYRDPIPQIQQMAKQLGYTLSRAEAQQVADQQNQNWEPQSWDEVLSKAEERAMQKIMGQLSPLLGEVQNIKKSAVETQLNDLDPMWREYEDDMISNLQAHPTLAKDPVKLYRLSVPQEVFESRATQKAIRRLEQKAQSSKIQGSSTTTRKPATGIGEKPVSFQEAFEQAKAALAEQGIRPGN